MSLFCGLTASLNYDPCNDFAPGLYRLWLGAYTSGADPVWVYGSYNLITGGTISIPTFYEVDQSARIEFAGSVWTPDDASNMGSMGTRVTTFFIWGLDAQRIAIAESLANRLYYAIFLDQNGKFFLHSKPGISKITTMTTGVAGGDMPGFELTLTSKVKATGLFEMDATYANTVV